MMDLDPELEAQLPETIRTVRAFYRSLSPEDRAKLDVAVENKGKSVEQKIKNNDSKYCYECGKIITRSAKFCEFCGVKQPSLT